MDPRFAYSELLKHLEHLDHLKSAASLLQWDELVNLPPKSSTLRANQNAAMSAVIHEAATSEDLRQILDAMQEGDAGWTAQEQAVIREARRDFDQSYRLPKEFVQRRTKAHSDAYHAWVQARKDDDFKAFLPHLRTNIQLAREQAGLLEASKPYDFWLDQFDPGMDLATVEALFQPLQQALAELITTIENSPVKPSTGFLKGFPVDQQDAFLRIVVKQIGFDFERGRIDTTVHPFCSGHTLDTRMTTRFDADNPLDSVSSAIHETGHALYQQGLPQDFPGTALAQDIGMAFHESQSRIWENQVGRSRAFWDHFEPVYREHFPEQLKDVSSEDLYLAINRVAITPIRVDADEVTYNLHIILRFELEKALISGDLDPADLPGAWNETSARILRYTPKSDREGCLQDVHWSGGMFGYFPSYTLGNLIGAQLWERITAEIPDLEDQFRRGDFLPLLSWLRTQVHARGRLHYTRDALRSITGAELSYEPLVKYLRGRYLPLYHS